MALDSIGRQTNQFDATLVEFGLKLGKGTQFGRADWRVVFWVREQNDPFVADEFVKDNVAICRVSLEVGSCAAKA